MQFSFGVVLLRALLSLGFLGFLAPDQTRSADTATSELPIVTSGAAEATCTVDSIRFNSSDSVLIGPAEASALDEFEVAVEDQDSIEMFRVDVQQFAFDFDPTVAGLAIRSRNTRPNISPPLLV